MTLEEKDRLHAENVRLKEEWDEVNKTYQACMRQITFLGQNNNRLHEENARLKEQLKKERPEPGFTCPACEGSGWIEGEPDMRLQVGPSKMDILEMKYDNLKEQLAKAREALGGLLSAQDYRNSYRFEGWAKPEIAEFFWEGARQALKDTEGGGE